MARELAPGVFTELFGRVVARSEVVIHAALDLAGEDVARETRASFVGQHSLHTPTPARRGGPPSRISSTLDRSIDHTSPRPVPQGWQVRIGPKPGQYPPYGGGRTDSATYGYYLEVSGAGKSRVRYPFLGPAFHRVVDAGRLYSLFKRTPWL